MKENNAPPAASTTLSCLLANFWLLLIFQRKMNKFTPRTEMSLPLQPEPYLRGFEQSGREAMGSETSLPLQPQPHGKARKGYCDSSQSHLRAGPTPGQQLAATAAEHPRPTRCQRHRTAPPPPHRRSTGFHKIS